MHHVVHEGACTTWSRRGRAPRGPGGGVHHVVMERVCTNSGRSKMGFDWSFCPSIAGRLAIGLASLLSK